MRKKLEELQKDLSRERSIQPVRRGYLAGEYNDKIADYSVTPSLTNHLLRPYIFVQLPTLGY